MSYGVWKKRGKGWSSIEIDGAGRDACYQWESYAKKYGKNFAEMAKKTARSLGVQCSTSLYSENGEDDFHYVRWATSQLKRKWKIVSCETGGDHSLWISYENEEGLKRAMEAFGSRVESMSLLNQ